MAQKVSNPAEEVQTPSPVVEAPKPAAVKAPKETDYMLMCSEFLATRHENVNLLRLFRDIVLKREGLPEYKLIKSLSDWEAEFKKFTK